MYIQIEMSIKLLIQQILEAIPNLLRLPFERMSFDYDKEADVYISVLNAHKKLQPQRCSKKAF